VEGIRIRKRVGFSKGTAYSSMAVRLNTRNEIINALTERNLLVDFGLQTGVSHSAYGVRISQSLTCPSLIDFDFSLLTEIEISIREAYG
jgi:hypothetical protein